MKITRDIENSEDYVVDDDDVLFSLLPIGGGFGLHNAPVTADIGWACFSLIESFGIESVIGIAGFDNAAHFKSWIEDCIGVPLVDWEGCFLTLYKCWMPCLHEQFQSLHTQTKGSSPEQFYEDQFSYVVWRAQPDSDAIQVIPTLVFAIRHRAYLSLGQGSVAAFHRARERSYAEATLMKHQLTTKENFADAKKENDDHVGRTAI